VLVDVNRVPELSGIRRTNGTLRIAAATRQSSAERSSLVAAHWPLLAQALPHVAHQQIRNRGTVGGSVAHADPGSEICTVLLAYDGHVEVTSTSGSREIPARDLFLGQFVTALEADEVLTAVVLPAQRPGTRTSFHEVARRHGDFALAGAATVVTTDDDGRCTHAAVALLGAAPTPIRRPEAEQVLVGQSWSVELVDEAVATATRDLEPASDVHGSSTYRVRAAGEMVRRSLTDAFGAAANDRRQAS
jgi:CO/xanthine dehydrogenase FAD-binding subunit